VSNSRPSLSRSSRPAGYTPGTGTKAFKVVRPSASLNCVSTSKGLFSSNRRGSAGTALDCRRCGFAPERDGRDGRGRGGRGMARRFYRESRKSGGRQGLASSRKAGGKSKTGPSNEPEGVAPAEAGHHSKPVGTTTKQRRRRPQPCPQYLPRGVEAAGSLIP